MTQDAEAAPRPWLRSLQARFTGLVVVVAAGLALLAGLVSHELTYRWSLRAGHATLEGLVQAIENTASIGAYTSDEVLLREIAGGLGRHPFVQAVQIRAGRLEVASGSLVAVSRDTPVVERVLRNPFDNAEGVGRLVVTGSVAALSAHAREQAWALSLLLSLQVLLIAALLFGAARRLITRPLADVAKTLRDMPPGTDKRLTIPHDHEHDEIGSLVRSGNALLDGIQQALDRERALRASVEAMEAQYRRIFDSSSAGIFVLDRQGRLINGNPMVLRITGLDRVRAGHMAGADFVCSVFAQPDKVMSMIGDARRTGCTVSCDLELRTQDGELRWVHCLISVQDGEEAFPDVAVVEGVMYDVTARLRAEQAAVEKAEVDVLTGLLSRRAMDERLDRWLSGPQAVQSLMLLFIDLDGFKQINDRHGHDIGDHVLKVCAQRIAEATRQGIDCVSRQGGDEFLVAMPGVPPEAPLLAQVSQRIVEAIGGPVVTDTGLVLHLGVSVGMASFPRHGTSRATLVRSADQVMYLVKRHGKNAAAMALQQAS